MADFLGRLAARALGVATVAQPAIAPRFAPGPRLADESSAMLVEAPRVPTDHVPSNELPRLSSSRDIEAPRAEVATPEFSGRLEERPTPPLPVLAETETVIRVDDFAPPDERPEARAQRTEPQWPTVIAPPTAGPELRTDALGEEIRSLPPAVEAQVHGVLEVTRVPTKEPTDDEPVLPHPTMPAVPWRGVQAPSNGRPKSQAEEPETTAPIVRVSIGRVEVRALFPEPQRPSAPTPRSSALSLSEYLKQRDGGMR